MARLLIYLKTNPSTNPNSYHRGDIVDAIPDGHDWGRLTTFPRFLRIEFLGVSSAKVRKYCEPDMEQIGIEPDGAPNMRVRNRRIFRFLFDDAPAALRNLVVTRNVGIDANTAHLVIGPEGDYTWKQVRRYLKSGVTGLTEEQEKADL